MYQHISLIILKIILVDDMWLQKEVVMFLIYRGLLAQNCENFSFSRKVMEYCYLRVIMRTLFLLYDQNT